jgi:hypothetical protein
MPERITNANDTLLPEIVHKHRVQRSASMTDIGKSIQQCSRHCRDSVRKNVGKRQNKYQCGKNLQLLSKGTYNYTKFDVFGRFY